MAKLILTTGNILESHAEALVNTVNCEGFMGKGLAYQFKKKFPKTNKSYIEACNKNELKPGKLHTFKEDGKIIINFPTKDKWREKSKIEYIEDGMITLNNFLLNENIKSVAIPPLGSGNGGLNWEEVKKVILKYVYPLSKQLNIEIYEPSLNYKAKIKQAPKLTLSHFVLMNIKQKLNRFSKFRLQKTAFFLNLFLNDNFFKFDANHYGPYSYPIELISKDIKEFQDYYRFTTDKALDYAYNTIISKQIEQKLHNFSSAIDLATDFINSISSNEKIELYSTIIFAILNNKNSHEEIVNYIQNWSKLKKEKFSEKKIYNALTELNNKHILERDLLGNYNLAIYENA
ncbi:type II toxin-antitoxin system antitoxin DNA ADP-ribosyl glycohydrolase DarG [Sulfurimonas sp.]